MQYKDQLTADRAREVFNYNRNTGFLTWKSTGKGRNTSLIAGVKRPDGYWYTEVDGVSYVNHRIIWLFVYGAWPSEIIDHINGGKDDNRIINLREATASINCQNQRRAQKQNATGFLGVTWDKNRGIYSAKITVKGKTVNLGRYSNPEKAHQAYIQAKRELHAGCTI